MKIYVFLCACVFAAFPEAAFAGSLKESRELSVSSGNIKSVSEIENIRNGFKSNIESAETFYAEIGRAHV